MAWAALISVLVSVLGPLLEKWIREWLDHRLHKAAATLPPPGSYASPQEAREALFEKAALMTMNPLKRLLLKRLQRHTRDADILPGHTPELPDKARAEIADFADVLDRE